jgi:endonuclease/exonuclease/phosphatase (EEP) superfamily protein YafD
MGERQHRLSAGRGERPSESHDVPGLPGVVWLDEPPPPGPTPSSGRPPRPLGRPHRPARPGRPVSAPAAHRPARLLTVVALLLLPWALTCFLDVAWPPVAAAASLTPMIVVPAVPVVALAISRRLVLPAALALVAAVVPWALLAPYGIAGPGEPAGATPLRLVSLDATAGTSAPELTAVAMSAHADVIVVTGLTPALAHNLTVAGIGGIATARFVQIPTDGVGIGLWTRDEVQVPSMAPVTWPAGQAAAGTLHTRSGDIQLVIADARGSALAPVDGWRAGLRQLPRLAGSGPRRLIVGCLDATPWQPAFRRLTSGPWHDAADAVGRGLRPTWPSWSPLPVTPVDHVLVAGRLGVENVETAQISGSTHRALVTTLKM